MDKEQVSLLLLQSMVHGADPRAVENNKERYVETAISLAEELNKALKDDKEE